MILYRVNNLMEQEKGPLVEHVLGKSRAWAEWSP